VTECEANKIMILVLSLKRVNKREKIFWSNVLILLVMTEPRIADFPHKL
jgi:hypothetical protein